MICKCGATVKASGTRGLTRPKSAHPGVLTCDSRLRNRRAAAEAAGEAGFDLVQVRIQVPLVQDRGTMVARSNGNSDTLVTGEDRSLPLSKSIRRSKKVDLRNG